MDEANSPDAISAAFRAGYSVEIDFRDREGRLVVAHDPPSREEYPILSSILDLHARLHPTQFLALNAKAAGLAELLPALGPSAFVFDVLVPEISAYTSRGIKVGVRVSEYELPPWNLVSADWVWLDPLMGDDSYLERMVANTPENKRIVLVSPELHGRSPIRTWQLFFSLRAAGHDLYLCTDHPERVLEMSYA